MKKRALALVLTAAMVLGLTAPMEQQLILQQTDRQLEQRQRQKPLLLQQVRRSYPYR